MTAQLTYTAFSVTVDGHGTQADVEITIDPSDGIFRIALPHYVTAIFKCEAVQADTLRGAVEQYESLCEEYQRVRLAHQGRKVIVVDATGCELDLMPHVGLKFYIDTEVDGKLLKHYGIAASQYPRLPYTEENVARLTALQDSIKTAATIMRDFMQTADPEKFLHEIRFATVAEKPPAAEPMELPLEASDDDEL